MQFRGSDKSLFSGCASVCFFLNRCISGWKCKSRKLLAHDSCWISSNYRRTFVAQQFNCYPSWTWLMTQNNSWGSLFIITFARLHVWGLGFPAWTPSKSYKGTRKPEHNKAGKKSAERLYLQVGAYVRPSAVVWKSTRCFIALLPCLCLLLPIRQDKYHTEYCKCRNLLTRTCKCTPIY